MKIVVIFKNSLKGTRNYNLINHDLGTQAKHFCWNKTVVVQIQTLRNISLSGQTNAVLVTSFLQDGEKNRNPLKSGFHDETITTSVPIQIMAPGPKTHTLLGF